jgi:hypothetical protein
MPNPSVRATASATSGSGTFTVTKPTGTASGDILLAFQATNLGASGAPSGPTGFALQDSITFSGASVVLQCFWKLAGGAEPSSYTFNNGPGQSSAVWLLSVQNASSSGPERDTTASGSFTPVATGNTTPNVNHELLSVATCWLTTSNSIGSQAFSDGTSPTDAGTITDSTTLALDVFYGSQTTAAAVQGTATINNLGAVWAAMIVAIPPGAAAPIEEEAGLTVQTIFLW